MTAWENGEKSFVATVLDSLIFWEKKNGRNGEAAFDATGRATGTYFRLYATKNFKVPIGQSRKGVHAFLWPDFILDLRRT